MVYFMMAKEIDDFLDIYKKISKAGLFVIPESKTKGIKINGEYK